MIYDLQKASVLKRISAFLLDFILVSILSVGFVFIISVITKYDDHNQKLQDYYAYYENEYNVDFQISNSDYQSLTDLEKENYNNAIEAFNNNSKALNEYNLIINLTLVMLTIGILIAYLITYFIIPIIFKNGQTIGKKVFSICLMKQNGVKVNNICLFVRGILGQYTIETMIPILIIVLIFYGTLGLIGFIILILILIIQIVLIITTKTNSLIHDVLAYTVVVDKSSQLIFNSEDDLIKYKEEVNKEKVAKSTY